MKKRIYTGLADRTPHFSMERGFYEPDEMILFQDVVLKELDKIDQDIDSLKRAVVYLRKRVSDRSLNDTR